MGSKAFITIEKHNNHLDFYTQYNKQMTFPKVICD